MSPRRGCPILVFPKSQLSRKFFLMSNLNFSCSNYTSSRGYQNDLFCNDHDRKAFDGRSYKLVKKNICKEKILSNEF